MDTLLSNNTAMISPGELKRQAPAEAVTSFIGTSRSDIAEIVSKNDPRLLTITGPCSIHKPEEALEIAKRLKSLQEEHPELYVVMRAYGEKPRTTLGWKGFLDDPHLDDSCDIDAGLLEYRKLLVEINKMGVPVAAEFLDPLLYPYYNDLISWGAIGARSSANPGHRTMASDLGLPTGFKNTTEGSIQIAADGVIAANKNHPFRKIGEDGRVYHINSAGNPDAHIILRGDEEGPNYHESHVSQAQEILDNGNINTGIIIDFSHQNSGKNHENQIVVASEVAKQIQAGNSDIVELC